MIFFQRHYNNVWRHSDFKNWWDIISLIPLKCFCKLVLVLTPTWFHKKLEKNINQIFSIERYPYYQKRNLYLSMSFPCGYFCCPWTFSTVLIFVIINILYKKRLCPSLGHFNKDFAQLYDREYRRTKLLTEWRESWCFFWAERAYVLN